MFKILGKQKQSLAWQNSVPSTVLMLMSAFQTAVWFYSWVALCVFDFIPFRRDQGRRYREKEELTGTKNNKDIIKHAN